MATPSFDLIDIIRTIQKRKRFIIIITVLAMLAGGLFLAVKKKKYKATASFLVNNPHYGDRSTLFRSYETRYVDFFGGDDELDKVTALANSDTVKDRIIRNCQFQIVYNQDINDPKGHAQLMNIFNKGFNVKRTEYKDIEVSYTAYDAVTAANVANMTVKVIEETYRHFYTAMKQNMSYSINLKVLQLDSTINALTDTLAEMRDKYGIYSLISPVRQGVMNGEVQGGSGKGFGRAIEEIQNIESIKDQLVSDRAHYISNLNEFATSENESMDFLKLITRALPPTSSYGPSLLMVAVIAGALGLFFSTIYVLIMAYFYKLNEVVR
jgi:capsular polysaccharide biosynthesis protein